MKITAPMKPAKTSGKQSKTKIAIVLINKRVPYQRKALLTVAPNLENLGENQVVITTLLIDIRKAIP
jgi:hypothetical protein